MKRDSKLTPEQALDFLSKLMNFDSTSFQFKKNVIDRLVNKVILYNDKIIIELNDTDLKVPSSIDNDGEMGGSSTPSESGSPF